MLGSDFRIHMHIMDNVQCWSGTKYQGKPFLCITPFCRRAYDGDLNIQYSAYPHSGSYFICILFPFFYFAIFCSAERTAIKYDDPHHYDPTTRVAGLFQGCLTRIAHSRWLGVDLLSSRLVGLLKYSLLYRVYLSLEAGQNPQTSNRNFTSWSISFSSSRSSISWMFRSPAPFLPWFLLFNPPSQSSL